MIEVIQLDDLIRRRFRKEIVLPGPAVERVNQDRKRELWLRRWVPEGVLRQLSHSFARSNTVHPSTAQALYSLARALTPEMIIETGTYWGYATTYLAAAVADSGSGQVWSFDLWAQAGQCIPNSLRPFVQLMSGRPSVESLPEVLSKFQPKLFFQDSLHDYQGVLSELKLVAPCMPAGSIIVFHDFIVDGVRKAARDRLPDWQILQLAVDDPQQLGIALRESLPD